MSSGPCRYPDTGVFYRKLNRAFPRIVRGEGCWLFDSEGKRYLDACGGAFVANIGHGVAEVAEAVARQAGLVAYVNGTAFTHDSSEELAAELSALCAPALPDGKVYFLGSGSEAVEAALKLARQYWTETGAPGKTKIVALTPGYHGNTLLALSASAREHYKTYYRGWLVDVPRVPAPYAYRCRCRGEDPRCPVCTGDVLEEILRREGPETVAAFIAEPVGGSSTGGAVPRPGYFKRVREICDRYKVLFVADEVLAGAGRTGTWCAIEPFGARPDILTMGKGISGGYVPLSAVVAPIRILDPIARGSGGLLHAQTFSHHPVACAAGLAAVRYLRKNDLLARCARMGAALHERLKALSALPAVGDIRGRGLLAGVEFVRDKGSRAPFPRARKFAETFTQKAQDAGLVVWPNTGQAAGGEGDLVMLAPPFVVSEAELDELVSRFSSALKETLSTLGQKEAA